MMNKYFDLFVENSGYAQEMVKQLSRLRQEQQKKGLSVGMRKNKIQMKHFRRQIGFWSENGVFFWVYFFGIISVLPVKLVLFICVNRIFKWPV